jgi:CheY-like chemotaxis protein
MKLLLVEDGRVNQMVSIKLLEARGHRVTLANHGREALDILEKSRFDAILMDVQMPEMNGYEATAAIRRREEGTGRHVPIIAMTANAMKGDREQCLAAGMDDYIAKPVQSDELYETVEKYANLKPRRETSRWGPWQPAAGPGAEAPAFDPEGFRKSIGHINLMRELIQIFFEDSPRLLTDAQHALDAKDAEALHEAIHALKGMVGNYSAAPAFQAICVLTETTRAGNLDNAPAQLDAVLKEMARLSAALEEFRKTV